MAWPTQGVCHLATLDGFATDLADSEWKALTSQEACERLLAATEPASDAAGDHLCEAVAGVAQHLQKTPADSALLGAAAAALQRGLEFLRTSAHQAGDQDVRVCALAFLALQVLSACESGDSKGGRQSHKTAVAAGACLTAVCSAASSLLSTSPDSKTALPICSSLAQGITDALTHSLFKAQTSKEAQQGGNALSATKHLQDALVALLLDTSTHGADATGQQEAIPHPSLSPASAWRLCFAEAAVCQLMIAACSGSTGQTGKDAHRAPTEAVAFLAGMLTVLAERSPVWGVQVLLHLTKVVGDSRAASHTGAQNLDTQGQELLLNALCSATTQLQDPLIAALLLRHTDLSKDLMSRAAVRKLLLDVASLALAAEHTEIVNYAARLISQGCQDRDATVRARALSAYREHVDVLFGSQHIDERTSDTQARPPAARLLQDIVLPSICPRLLDSAKSVRNRALQLLHDLLAYTPHATRKEARNTHTAKCQRASAQAALPVLFMLLDARPDGPLYDKTSVETVQSVVGVCVRCLGEAELLRMILQQATRTSAAALTSKTDTDTATAPVLSSLSGQELSQGLMDTLLQQCGSLSTEDTYAVVTECMETLTGLDQVQALSRVVTQLPNASLLYQHAMPALCAAMAKADPTELPWLTHCQEALQVIYVCAPAAIRTRHTTDGVSPHTQPQRTQRPTHTAPPTTIDNTYIVDDTVCELAVLMDLAALLHREVHVTTTQELAEPAQVRMTNSELLPASPSAHAKVAPVATIHGQPGSQAYAVATHTLTYCLRAAHAVLSACHECDTVVPTAGVQRGVAVAVAVAAGQAVQLHRSGGAGVSASRQTLWAASRLIARSLKSFFTDGLLHTTDMATVDSAMQLLCACSPVALAAKLATGLLLQLEQRAMATLAHTAKPPADATITTCSRDAQQAHADTVGAAMSVRDVVSYVGLLYHMCQLYETDVADFKGRAARQTAAQQPSTAPAAKTAVATGVGVEAAVVPADGQQQQQQHGLTKGKGPSSGGKGDKGSSDFDYMAAEERTQAVNRMAQTYLDEVMERTAPSNRSSVLAGLLAHSSGDTVPASAKALAVRALGRMMCLSDTFASRHQQCIADALVSFLNTSPTDTVDAAQQSSLLITSEALAVTSRLIVGSPNINAGLLVPIQQLVSGLLDMEAKQRKDASGPGVLVREVLIQAMVCYTEVLTSDKLQLSGNTWRLVARCALSEEGQIRDLARAVLATLVNQQPAVQGHNTTARRQIKTTGTSAQGAASGRYAALLALYGNCHAHMRQHLVEQVILGAPLVSSSDMANDGLVLPVLQSLCLADTAPARSAALALLQPMTPSARALAALAGALQKQSLGLSRMSPSESRHVIQVLTRLVTRHSPPATATTTLPTTATNTMTNTSEQQPGQVAPTDALPGNVPRITQQGVVTDGQGAVGDVQGVAVSSVGTGQGALGDAGEGQNGSVRKRGRSSAQCASVPGVGSAGGVRGTGQGAGGGSGALQSKLLAQLADLAAGGTVTRSPPRKVASAQAVAATPQRSTRSKAGTETNKSRRR